MQTRVRGRRCTVRARAGADGLRSRRSAGGHMLLPRSRNTEVGEEMRARGWAASALAAAALAWAGAGYLATKPVDFHDYRVTAVQAAQSAYDALATASLTGSALLAGRVTQPYANTMLDDARSALAGAAKQFTGVAAPDD